MNLRRTMAFGAVVGGVAALVAGAATSGSRPADPPPSEKAAAVEASGAQLAAEIARLHERLRPTIAPQARARNLFAFSAAKAIHSAPALPRPAISDAAVVSTAPERELKLIGIAEDSSPDGATVRTAILSGFGELFLVKEGETVKDRFRVAKISTEAVELTNISDNTPLDLTLK